MNKAYDVVMIWVAADEEKMAEVRRKRDYYGKRGLSVEEPYLPSRARKEHAHV